MSASDPATEAGGRRRANFFGQRHDNVQQPDPIDRVVAGRLARDNFHSSDSFAALEQELGGGATQLVARVGAALLPEIGHLNVPLGTAVAQVLGRLTHAEKLSIASGTIPPSVTQTIAAEVNAAKETQRQQALVSERALLDGGMRLDGRAEGGFAGSFARGGFRGSSEGRLRADGLSLASLSPGLSGSAAHYTAHPESVSMLNYAKTPYAATGMSHATFQHLTQHRLPDGGRFSGQTIVNAGQDARVQQFSASNRRVATNLATLDHYDPQRREERNRIFLDVRKTAEADAELKRLAAAYAAAKTPEERARIKGQFDARGQQVQGKAGLSAHIAALPAPAQAAGRDQGQATIDDVFIKLIPDPKLREELRQQFEASKQVGVDGSPQSQAAWQQGLRNAAGNDPQKLAAVEALIKQRDAARAQPETATAIMPTELSKAAAIEKKQDDLLADITGTNKPDPAKVQSAATTGATAQPSPSEPAKAPSAEQATAKAAALPPDAAKPQADNKAAPQATAPKAAPKPQ